MHNDSVNIYLNGMFCMYYYSYWINELTYLLYIYALYIYIYIYKTVAFYIAFNIKFHKTKARYLIIRALNRYLQR